ncbi:hypothetical protein BDQ12DRAFT_689051, partial [Crucibulum laeve]
MLWPKSCDNILYKSGLYLNIGSSCIQYQVDRSQYLTKDSDHRRVTEELRNDRVSRIKSVDTMLGTELKRIWVNI